MTILSKVLILIAGVAMLSASLTFYIIWTAPQREAAIRQNKVAAAIDAAVQAQIEEARPFQDALKRRQAEAARQYERERAAESREVEAAHAHWDAELAAQREAAIREFNQKANTPSGRADHPEH